MLRQAKLVIAIPTYRRPEVLSALLSSICPQVAEVNRRQKTACCEIAISDNSEERSSETMIGSLFGGYDFIYYNRNTQNVGAIENFYKAALMRPADYCWVLGDDDQVYDNSIAGIVELLQGLTSVNVVTMPYPTPGEENLTETITGREFFRRFAFDKINLISRHIFAQQVLRAETVGLSRLPVYAIYPHFHWMISGLLEGRAVIYGRPVVARGPVPTREYWQGRAFIAHLIEWNDYEIQIQKLYDLAPEELFSRFSPRALIRNYLIFSLLEKRLPPLRPQVRFALRRRFGWPANFIIMAGTVLATPPVSLLVRRMRRAEISRVLTIDFARRA